MNSECSSYQARSSALRTEVRVVCYGRNKPKKCLNSAIRLLIPRHKKKRFLKVNSWLAAPLKRGEDQPDDGRSLLFKLTTPRFKQMMLTVLLIVCVAATMAFRSPIKANRGKKLAIWNLDRSYRFFANAVHSISVQHD